MKQLYTLLLLILGCSNFLGATPMLWNTPHQNMHFVGRNKILENIKGVFHTSPVCVLTGGPGFGKSQTAKQFAYLHNETYDIVWWFRADQPLLKPFEKFASSVTALLEPREQIKVTRFSSEKLREAVNNALRQKPLKCLLIFDNVTDFETLAPYLPETSRSGIHILMTSRRQVSPHKNINIDKFSKTESIVFIRQLLPQLSDKSIMKLVDYFGDHPLALATAASFLLAHPSVSVARYVSSHDLQREETPTDLFVDQHEHNLHTTLWITLDVLSKEHPEVCQVLKFLTLLHPGNVPFSYIQCFLKKKGVKKTADYVVSTLYAQSLVEVRKNDNPQKVRLSVHELIHKLIKNQIPEAEKRALIEQAIVIVAELFAGRSDVVIPRIINTPEYLLHAQKLSEEAKKFSYHSVPLLSLRIRMLDCLMGGLRDFEAAKSLIADIRVDQKHLQVYQGDFLEFGVDAEVLSPLDEAILEINLGYFEGVYAPNYAKALAHEKRALQILETLSHEPEEILRVITGLAQSYIYVGKLEEAGKLVEKGKKFLKYSKAPLTNFFFIYGAQADWLMFKGQYPEALDVMEKGAFFLKGSNVPVYEIGLFLQQAIALAFMEQQAKSTLLLNKAQKMINDFFEHRESNLAGTLKIFQAFNNIGVGASVDQSKKLVTEALQIFAHTFHGTHKHVCQGFAYFVLGQCYERTGDTQKAIEAYLKSEDIYNTVLKERAIDDVSRLYSALSILGLKLQDKDLAREYMGKQMETFGLNHPGTLKIAHYALEHKMTIPYPVAL